MGYRWISHKRKAWKKARHKRRRERLANWIERKQPSWNDLAIALRNLKIMERRQEK